MVEQVEIAKLQGKEGGQTIKKSLEAVESGIHQ